jgi:myo-inositol-1(or 4)-monophosphatase
MVIVMNFDIEIIKAIVLEAGKLFSDDKAANAITEKGAADFVTAVDFASQNFIKSELEKYYPKASLLSEEGDHDSFVPQEYTFVLDPVDGTTNLIHRYRQSAVSLGLLHNGKPYAGVVYNPFTNELFWAEKGKGAYFNGKPMHVSPQSDFSKCMITIGTMPYYKEYADKNFDLFKRIYLDAVDIRRTGSSALDLCYTADGRTEAFFERGLKAWDFSAGAIILTEAGGIITDWNGQELDFYSQQNVVASNGCVHDRMLGYLEN